MDMNKSKQVIKVEVGASSAKYGLWVAIISMVIIGGFSALSNLIHG